MKTYRPQFTKLLNTKYLMNSKFIFEKLDNTRTILCKNNPKIKLIDKKRMV